MVAVGTIRRSRRVSLRIIKRAKEKKMRTQVTSPITDVPVCVEAIPFLSRQLTNFVKVRL
jgi:hypothetical protein